MPMGEGHLFYAPVGTSPDDLTQWVSLGVTYCNPLCMEGEGVTPQSDVPLGEASPQETPDAPTSGPSAFDPPPAR